MAKLVNFLFLFAASFVVIGVSVLYQSFWVYQASILASKVYQLPYVPTFDSTVVSLGFLWYLRMILFRKPYKPLGKEDNYMKINLWLFVVVPPLCYMYLVVLLKLLGWE